MKTFGDCKVGDKLYIINNNGTIDICNIQNINHHRKFVFIKYSNKNIGFLNNTTFYRFVKCVICSNPITAKAVLEELQENINFSLKKLENENI